MQNFIQPGQVVTLPAPYTVTSGQGALIGTLFGVSMAGAANGVSGEFLIEGVVALNKNTSNAASVGFPAYWDNVAREITPVANGTVPVGFFVAAALAADTTARVKLTPHARRTIFVSTEQTGTGSPQNIAHGLGLIPTSVLVAPSDLTPATVGSFLVTEGTHTTTNVVLTVTNGKKYKVVAIA